LARRREREREQPIISARQSVEAGKAPGGSEKAGQPGGLRCCSLATKHAVVEPVPRTVFSSVSRAASRAYSRTPAAPHPALRNNGLRTATRQREPVRRSETDDRRPMTDDRRPTTDDRRPTTAESVSRCGQMDALQGKKTSQFSLAAHADDHIDLKLYSFASDEPVQALYTLPGHVSLFLNDPTGKPRTENSSRTRNPSRVVPARSPWVLLKYPALGTWCLRAARAPGSRRSCARISPRRLFKPR